MPPLKRYPALQPLSREHHEILLAVWKLRRGLALGVLPERMAAYVKHFSENYLALHNAREQCLLELIPDGQPLIARYNSAIEQIRKCIASVVESPNVHGVEQLANLIYDTVRFEERELFAHVQEILSEEQMQLLNDQLQKMHVTCPVWKDIFW